MDTRTPLAPLPTNTPFPSSHPHAYSSPSSSTASSSAGPSTRKLAPIFTNSKRSPHSHPHSSIVKSDEPRKRPKLEHPIVVNDDENFFNDGARARLHGRVASIPEWFLPSTTAHERVKQRKERVVEVVEPMDVDEVKDTSQGVWRRPRARLGVASTSSLIHMSRQRLLYPQDPYLSTLVTSIAPYNPLAPPSILLLPSIHPATGRPRDFSPPLTVAFNSIAKYWDESSARAAGKRRLVAVAGEEGGVRIVDVDEGLGAHREEKGYWWRAHGNAIFDFKWSADDARVLSASGDQSTRLHTLDTPNPTLIATLRGHTSSVKSAVFFDPSRSHSDPSIASSIIATGGRDGNILIYDIRCQGRSSRESESPSPSRSQSRDRYTAGVPGFAAQHSENCLDPVIVINQAHGDGKRRAGRTSAMSVTSLVALQSMPGALASGGSYDAIVKLWDLRFTGPIARHPDGRSTCTAAGSLPDPTLSCPNPSRRARSINAMCERPTTGDLYALCGDSQVHALRPSAATPPAKGATFDNDTVSDAILPKTYTDPNLLVSSFYMRLAMSPDGRYMSAGSCKGGVMTWDLNGKADVKGKINATRLRLGPGGIAWPEGKEREVCAVDWGKDLLAACSDDLATRIWRSNPTAARSLRQDPSAEEEWVGAVGL